VALAGGIAILGVLGGEATARQLPPLTDKATNAVADKDSKGDRDDRTGKASDIDDRSPLPPVGSAKQEVLARIPVPNPDRAIFSGRKDARGNWILGTGIVDFEEIASEKKNSDEYQAWHELVQHAKTFTNAELEENARRDLTRDDLIGVGPSPRQYRLKLIAFEGKLTRVRRLAATRSLQEAGTAEVYEGQLNPFDEPPTDFISIVFTELPPALSGLAQLPPGQWLDVNRDATAAGFFFKVKQDPHQTDKQPVLIGKSVRVWKESSAGSIAIGNGGMDVASQIPIDAGLQVFKGIKDDARIAKGDENWQEAVAWNRVLLHARRFSPEELEANARTDLKFADLFESVRKDYKLQLIQFEGRLLMVRKMEPSQKLRAAGLTAAYEGWIAPKDEPRGNPICAIFTDPPPEGMELGRVNKWVTFAGYSFKLLHYESGELRQDDPSRHVTKKAPLLIGRAIVLRPDPEAGSPVTWGAFWNVALGSLALLVVIAGGITWWFRRGDKRAQTEIETHRVRNPFQA
jgi:hypothetical protein